MYRLPGPNPVRAGVAGLVLEDRLELLDRVYVCSCRRWTNGEQVVGLLVGRDGGHVVEQLLAGGLLALPGSPSFSSNGCSWLTVTTPWVGPRQASGQLVAADVHDRDAAALALGQVGDARPSQPVPLALAVTSPACQMSIDSKCERSGFG